MTGIRGRGGVCGKTGAVGGWAFAGLTEELTNTTPNAHTLPTTPTHHQKYTEIPPEPAGAGDATPHAAIGSPTFLGLGQTWGWEEISNWRFLPSLGVPG